MKMVLPSTTLQISVAKALEQVRSLHLRNALMLMVKKLELSILNHQLDENAPANDFKELAALGIRGELVFPVRCLIEANPRLIGYYRLLMGFSQSHQSAKQLGFVEFWTIYNVGILDKKKAHEKSPTTHRFYSLPELSRGLGNEYEDFQNRIASLVGIRV